MGNLSDETAREVLRSLWEYVRPWHLAGFVLKPVYPQSHHTGRSVLDRHALLSRLEQRFMKRKRSLEHNPTLTDVRFGQVIHIQSPESPNPNYVWLFFQQRPGLYEMNAALLNPRGIDISLPLAEKLHEMVSGKTFWGESDLSLLLLHAKAQGNVTRLDIMVAEQQGVPGLWVKNRDRKRWTPVGRVHYATRRNELVTLIRTISLTQDSQLRSVSLEEVRRPIHLIPNMVISALRVIGQYLEGCMSVTLDVTIDKEKGMYRVTFSDRKSAERVGELLIHRTVDLLEVLRRPDNDCEPVVVNGKKLVWNRFRNIRYDKDVGVLKSGVDRRDPFPGMLLRTPPTADSLLSTEKRFDFVLELYHDPWTCPLRHISLEDIRESHKRTLTSRASQIMLRFDSHWGEPAHISNEPGLHHGSCWKVHVVTPHTLTSELRDLTLTRFTDGQVRSLLSFQELVYWSEGEQRWATHSFRLVVQKDCVEEVRESWHLRTMLEKLTGRKYDPALPGVDLQNPDKWSPSIRILPEHVRLCLRDRTNRSEEERIVRRRNVALMERREVQELLEREMDEFLELCGIIADRNLSASIRREIEDSMNLADVSDDERLLELDGVVVELDKTGGEILYVVLYSETDKHKIAITGHLHNMGQTGRIKREEFESEVKSCLREYSLSDDDMKKAVRECVRVMRKKKLITR